MTRQNGLMASLKAFKARLAQTNGYKAMKRNIKLIEIIAIPVVFAALPIAVNHKVNSTQIPQHVQNNPKFIAYAIKFFNLQGRLLCLFDDYHGTFLDNRMLADSDHCSAACCVLSHFPDHHFKMCISNLF